MTGLTFVKSFITTGFIGYSIASNLNVSSSNFTQTMNYDGGDYLGCLVGKANGVASNHNLTFDSLIISCTWQGDNSTANITGLVGEISYMNVSWTNSQVTEIISLFERYSAMIGSL